MCARAEARLRPTIRANFALTLAGNVGYAAAQWSMVVLIARLGSPEVVGRFTLALAMTTPLVLLANLQLRGVQATDARHEHAFGDYLGLRLVTSALALVVIAGYGLLAMPAGEPRGMLLAVAAGKVVEAVGDVLHGLFQARERMDLISRSLVLRGVLEVPGLAAGSLLTGSVVVGVLCVAAARLTVLLLHDLRAGARLTGDEGGGATGLRPRWEPRALRRLAWRALPLGIVTTLIALNTSIPRCFIERHLGEAQLGLFAAMASFTLPGGQVVLALGQSATARLAQHHAQGDHDGFRRLVGSLIGVSIAVGGAGVLLATLAGEPLLAAFYGPAYVGRADVLVLVMAGAAAGYVASGLGFALTATRCFDRLMLMNLPITGAALIAAWALIPAHGLIGAALATCIVAAASGLIYAGLLSVAARGAGPP